MGPGRAATLAAFVAGEADDALSTAKPPGEAVQLLSAARARVAQRRRTRRAFVGVGAATGTCALVALAVLRLTSPAPAVLSYTVDGATPPPDGYVQSSPVQQPKLAFSDGTDIQMMARARAHVVEVGRRGARLNLEDGRVHVHVAHRPGADWQVQAGAYLIHVHGTSFFVEWNALAARLDVQMESGVISVDGPRPGETVTLRAGQSLSAHPGEAPTLTAAGQALAVRVPAAASPESRAPAASGALESRAPVPSVAPAPPLAPSRPAAPPSARPGWAARLADGEAEGIVAEAQRRGIGAVLASASSEDLAALADAARFRKQDRLAERVLIAQRTRFPGSVRSEEASFLLGRLADGRAGRDAVALAWYDRYLREAPSGAYADEAMGRMMIVLQRQHRDADARKLALSYLRRFPQGSYAGAAQAVTSLGP